MVLTSDSIVTFDHLKVMKTTLDNEDTVFDESTPLKQVGRRSSSACQDCLSAKGNLGGKAEVELTEVVGLLRVR
jgi:hypothetical protein